LATYNATQVKDPPGRTALGSGQVNTVYRVEYNGPDATPKAFKQVASQDTSPASMAGIAGIDRDNPAYAARNVATSIMNEALGLDVVPKTSFAAHGQELGIVMDLVAGKAPSDPSSQGQPLDDATHRKISAEQAKVDAGTKSPAAFKQEMALLGFKIDAGSGEWRFHPANATSLDLAHPVLQNKLNNLEWLDIINGQIDRNNSNYLVTFDGNGQPNGVKGIDNDFSFGTNQPKASNVGKTDLPRMIDSDTADAIEQLGRDWHSPGGMKERLSGLLGPEATAGVESRLFGKTGAGGFPGVLDHIQTLKATNMVVPHGQWDTWKAGDGSSPHEVATAGHSKFASLAKQIEVENVNEAKEQAKW
jgi:hypothetical protein